MHLLFHWVGEALGFFNLQPDKAKQDLPSLLRNTKKPFWPQKTGLFGLM